MVLINKFNFVILLRYIVIIYIFENYVKVNNKFKTQGLVYVAEAQNVDERTDNHITERQTPNYRYFPRGRLKLNYKKQPKLQLQLSSNSSLIEKLKNILNYELTSESKIELPTRPISEEFLYTNSSKFPYSDSRTGGKVFRSPEFINKFIKPLVILPNSKGNEFSNDVAASNNGRIPAGAAAEFSKHTIVTPRLIHTRSKREISSTSDQTGHHHHHITLGLTIEEQDILVDLQLNRDLLSEGYFEKQISNGAKHIRRPKSHEVGLCHYQGSIRDKPGSWAALSTCDGIIKGIVYDGSEIHYLEPIPHVTSITARPHFLLRHEDLIPKNITCGYAGKPHPVRDLFHDENFARLLRYKRDTSREYIRGPFNADALSRYVELILVTDKTEYEKFDNDVEKIYKRCKDIANIVNALYQPLNIFIALVGVEVWKDEDEVEISTDGDKTLTKFLNYRKLRLIPEHPNDNAQLLTGKVFDSGVVGKALKGPICTYQYSGGVNMDHSDSVGLVATTVAHEMGHNFGMEHDTEEDCKCPDKRCIMAPSSGTKSPSHWSSCSHEYLAISFERSMDYCLRNKPTSLFNSPVCGNGFVEPGEQCDCGLPDHCDNSCCNATTCMLFRNATCATGHCCDLHTCRPKESGVECRPSLHECDLPEYCSGFSEYCPENFYKEDAHECLSGQAYCYEGMCRTHEHQCRLLWGPTGKNSDDKCYVLNKEGNSNGNCGYNWATEDYRKCNNVDVKCGMMHCKHFNERLEFGMESVSKVSHRFIADSQGVIPCRVAQVDLGLDMVDPGLAPDGAKCGYNKMCVDQRCMEVSSLRKTKCDCNGNGVCNNKGNCHCDVGFSWPNCLYPGLGGSKDSGPATNPNAKNHFVVGMLVFFLGVLPLLVIPFLAYYVRGNLKLWWLRKGIPAKGRLSGREGAGRPGSIAPGMGVDVVTKSSKVSTGGSKAFGEVASPSPPSSQGSKSNSPLLNGYANGPVNGPVNGPAPNFSGAFFGIHEGFTLSPIKDKSKDRGESAPPSAPPLKSSTPVSKSHSSVTSPTSPKGSWRIKPSSLPAAAWPPAAKGPSGARVDISEPSLQASTNPAVGAPSQSVVVRPAPPPPPNPPPATVAHDATGANTRRSNNRPKSVPDASALIVHQKSSSLERDNCLSSPDGSYKESKQSTVARIASFLGKKEKPEVTESFQSEQNNTLPRKATKINRESLLQLEISHPMQLQATELPNNLVPVRSAPDPPMPSNIKPSEVKAAQNKSPEKNPSKVSWAPNVSDSACAENISRTDLLRIGSVREKSVTTRPPIHKFGSLRAPRPKSLPPTRPSQPPPRPPLPMIPGTPESDSFYDECFDEQEGTVPFADAEEGLTPQERIYATIDEDSPKTPDEIIPSVDVVSPAKKEKKSLFSLLYSKSSKKKAQPKESQEPLYCNVDVDVKVEESASNDSSSKSQRSSVDRTSSGSIEGGLLSEIVTELANREPQYVNTLSKNKKSLSASNSESDSIKLKATSSLQPSPTKSNVNKDSFLDKRTNMTSSQPQKTSDAQPKTYFSTPAKPRGVFSYLKKSNSEDAPSKGSVRNADAPIPEITSEQSLKSTLPAVSNASNVKVIKTDPSVSYSKSLGAVSTTAKDISVKKSPTYISDSKISKETNVKYNPPLKNTFSTSSNSQKGTDSLANAHSVTPTTHTASKRLAFPPDKVLHHDRNVPSKTPLSHYSAKKPLLESKPINSKGRSGTSGTSTPTGAAGKVVGRVTSPSRVAANQSKESQPKSVASSGISVRGPLTEKPRTAIAPKPKSLTGGAKRTPSAPVKVENKAKISLTDKGVQGRPLRAASAAPKFPSTSSKSAVLAAAAQGSSHVASLQQKFEGDGTPNAKPISNAATKKPFEKTAISAKPK